MNWVMLTVVGMLSLEKAKKVFTRQETLVGSGMGPRGGRCPLDGITNFYIFRVHACLCTRTLNM